ncbi:MAG: ABC transporter permease [Acidobacteriota bacterium]
MGVPIRYNLRSLFQRRTTTAMTVLSIAFVVLVFIGVSSLAAGISEAFAASGDPANLLVLRDGARSETESAFDLATARGIAAMPGVERTADDRPLASGEMIVVQIFEREDGSESNVTVRGVGPMAQTVRPDLEIVEGRDFVSGTGEIIVGSDLAQRFRGLRLGEEVRIGLLDFRVVGIFEAGGGNAEAEIWGALEDVGNTFRRENAVSSMRLRTSSAAAMAELERQVESDQRWRVVAQPETQYYAEQTSANTMQFRILGTLLAVLMGFGACFAAANTMYAAIERRGREIGTLRALGFRRPAILLAFLLEAAFLGLLGGIVGCILALPLNGISAGTTNFISFSEITFQLTTTPAVLISGLLVALATGIVGGLPPAIAAARRPITGLLRGS